MITPVHLLEAQSNMRKFDLSGFPGCVGLCDCSHIVSEHCEYNLKKQSFGCKEFSNHQNIQLDMQSPSLHITYNKRRAWRME